MSSHATHASIVPPSFRRVGGILTVLALVAFAAPFPGCGGNGKQEAEPPDAAAGADSIVTLPARSVQEIGVALCTVEERPLAGVFTAPARLVADQDLVAQVGSFLPGRVQSVAVRIGDRVRRGQVLMRIEGLEIGSVKAEYIKARARLQYAEQTLARQRGLTEQNIGAKKALLEAQAEYDMALASFNAEDKKIHAVGLSDQDADDMMRATPAGSDAHASGQLPIRAPIDGVVVERNVVIGQLVDQGSTAFRIVDIGTLWADADVHEKDLAFLPTGGDVLLHVAAWPGEAFPGRISYVGEVLDEHSRMVKVRATVPNPRRRLKPEMYGALRMAMPAGPAGPVIPRSALFEDAGEHCVFVAVNDTTFLRRAVRPGPSTADSVLVGAGLRAGERVVASGAFLLRSELRKDAMGGE